MTTSASVRVLLAAGVALTTACKPTQSEMLKTALQLTIERDASYDLVGERLAHDGSLFVALPVTERLVALSVEYRADLEMWPDSNRKEAVARMMKRIDNEQVFVVVISAGDFEVQPGEISLVNDSKQESVPATTTSPALQSKVAEEHVARGFVTFPRTTDEGDLTYALRIPHSINTGAFYTSDAGHSILQFDNTELDILKMVEKGLDEDEIRDRLGIDWDVSGSDVRRVADAAIAVLQILAK